MSLLSDLETIRRKETEKKTTLSEIKPRFYPETLKRIQEMEALAQSFIEKGDLDKFYKLRHDIDKIRNAYETIFRLRIKKIFEAVVWKREIKNMTREEEYIYEQVKEVFEYHYKKIVLGEEVEALKLPSSPDTERKVVPKTEQHEPQKQEEYVLVRYIGPNMSVAMPSGDVFLKKEDVLHMPKKYFEIFSKKGMVEKLDI